jgi:hypothetical protein
MNPIQSTLLIIFGIIAYLTITDKSVAQYLTLVFKLIETNVERFFWMVKYHPNNFITTWQRNREYDKIAKELEKEFMSKYTE